MKKSPAKPTSATKKSRSKSPTATVPPIPAEDVAPPVEEVFPDIKSDVCTYDGSTIDITGDDQRGKGNENADGSLKSVNSKKQRKRLPIEEFRKLKLMREVYMGGKELTRIPDVVFDYFELRILWLNSNRIEAWNRPLVTEQVSNDDELMRRNDMAYENSLKQSERIQALNRTKLSGLQYLTELYLHGNRLKTLDGSGIHLLKHLKILSLHSNLLTDLSKVIQCLGAIRVENLSLIDNPCSFEEGYKEKVLEHFQRSIRTLDHHNLNEDDWQFLKDKSRAAKSSSSKAVVFGKLFTPVKLPERTGMMSETVKDLEKRCQHIRAKTTATMIREEQLERETMRTAFLKTLQESMPPEEPEEENIYDTLRRKYQNVVSSNSTTPHGNSAHYQSTYSLKSGATGRTIGSSSGGLARRSKSAGGTSRKDYIRTFWTNPSVGSSASIPLN